MKIAGICFTREGVKLAGRIDTALNEIYSRDNLTLDWFSKGRFVAEDDKDITFVNEPVQQWAEKRFSDCDCMIFIGAAGIAVRTIAPFVRDKRTDPAVIVLDERGKFCISLLSGHIGGANHMVEKLAAKLDSVPVITTATDVSHRFAVDVYATEHNMVISNMTYAKEVSAALLAGEPVGFHTNFEVEGELPEGIYWEDKLGEMRQAAAEDTRNGTSIGIYISPSYNRAFFDHTLWLIPRCLIVGIGCKKGTPASKIEKLVTDTLRAYSLYPEAIKEVASIDLKKDEPGLVSFCANHFLPLRTYSAEELSDLTGSFTPSAFVKEQVGVDNVCERSAMMKGDDLIIRKQAADGVTVAVALVRDTLRFHD